MQGLDTSRLLTRGEPFNLRNLMRRVSPAMDLAAVIWDEVEPQTCFGQIEKNELLDFAQMSYVGGLDHPDNRIIASILEELVVTAGDWGAYGVLVELPEQSPLFEGFRLAGFSIWARQTVFQLPSPPAANPAPTLWRPLTAQDKGKLLRLHRKQLPAFTQTMVPIGRRADLGMVSMGADGECLAYAELYQGPKGVWILPLFSTEADHDQLLLQLPAAVPNPTGKPLYLSTRSYQPLVAASAQRLDLAMIGSQILMVKHLLLRDKVEQSALQKIFESGSIEGSMPVSQIEGKPN